MKVLLWNLIRMKVMLMLWKAVIMRLQPMRQTAKQRKLQHFITGFVVSTVIKEAMKNTISRLYVHLSKDYGTAVNVGKRHGKPVIYKIKSHEMEKDGYDFFLSANQVWLTKRVPVKYLEKMNQF